MSATLALGAPLPATTVSPLLGSMRTMSKEGFSAVCSAPAGGAGRMLGFGGEGAGDGAGVASRLASWNAGAGAAERSARAGIWRVA